MDFYDKNSSLVSNFQKCSTEYIYIQYHVVFEIFPDSFWN